MKCPKCGYLGFEPVDRCRNCGYDFSLNEPAADPELSIRGEEPAIDPLADLALVDAAAIPRRTIARPPSSELPLFRAPVGVSTLGPGLDEPLIGRPSPPRAPLAVRRATPDVPRLRVEQPKPQPLELEPDVVSVLAAPTPESSLSAWPVERDEPESRAEVEDVQTAGLAARAAATIVDLAILAAIDAAVVYFTLQICGLTIADWAILPRGPLLAFLLVQNVGYLIVFTTGGQTLGKMLAGIKVVADQSDSPLDVGRATLRTIVWILLALPAGLGFLTALLTSDHRALHDRLARTRVIRG